MHQRSKPRRWEEPPAAAEFGRSRVAVCPPPPPKGDFGFRKQSNTSWTAFDSAYSRACSADDSFSIEIKERSSKKASEIHVKELIYDEMSKDKETRHPPSPSLIAKLMGVDSFPSIVKQKKNMDISCQKSLSTDLLGICEHPEGCSQLKNKEKQDFKDVFVVATYKKKKNTSHLDSRGMVKCRGYEHDLSDTRKKFMDMKYRSPDEVQLHQSSKEFNGAFGVADSSKDLFLELLRDPNSLFAKHLQDLKHARPSPHLSKITILKPCKSAEHLRSKVNSRSSITERNFGSCLHMQQEGPDFSSKDAARLGKCSVEENTGSVPHDSFSPETFAHPAHIVILRPCHAKVHNMAQTSFPAHDSLSSKKGRKCAAHKFLELHDERANKQMSHRPEELIHLYGSEENAKEIKRKIRSKISSLRKSNFKSEMNIYQGIDSSTKSVIADLFNAVASSHRPDSFGEWSNSSYSPTSSYSTESYPSGEALNHFSERWNITCRDQYMGYTSQGSSAHREMIALSDKETPKFTLVLNNKNIADGKLACDEVLSKGCQLGVRRKYSERDGSSRFSPKTKTLPTLGTRKLSNIKSDDRCGTSTIEDLRNIGLAASSDAKFSIQMPRHKISEDRSDKFQLADSVGKDDTLPEREIHVNSEGLRTVFHEKNDINLHSLPVNQKRDQVKSSALIPTIRDEILHLTTQVEEVMQSTLQVPSANERLVGRIQNDMVIQVKTTDQSQVKLLPSELDNAKSISLSSLDLEQTSPISVLENPSEDETNSVGCFERLSADLKELRMQLQRLKRESAASHVEEREFLVLSDEDCERGYCNFPPTEDLQAFRDDDDRDFTYLLDILVESDIHSIDDDKLLKACHLLGCSLDQIVFSKLEKKYDQIASWPRSERKLLFDLINCTLMDEVNLYMDVHRPVRLKACKTALNRECIVEGLWQMVVKRRKDLQCNMESKILEPGWLCFDYRVDLVVMEIERMLQADLVEELVTEVF